MTDNTNIDTERVALTKNLHNVLSENAELFAEDPHVLDAQLLLIIADICRTAKGREYVRKKFSITQKTSAIFSQINRSNVRHYTSVFNVSFQSAIPYKELIEELQYGGNLEFTPRPVAASKEEELFHLFCEEFWLGAMRQIAKHEYVAALVFGISTTVLKAIKESTNRRILTFTKSPKQCFHLRMDERFFQALNTIESPITNDSVALIKMAYAAQSLACFSSLPSSISSTELLDFSDVVACMGGGQTWRFKREIFTTQLPKKCFLSECFIEKFRAKAAPDPAKNQKP